MKILNLGCGTKVGNHPDILNIDWSFYIRIKKLSILQPFVPILFKGERLKCYQALNGANVLAHNLARGLPFPNDSVDAVYHSHFLEHLERDIARKFLLEVRRVLRPGGIQRVVVPDFEQGCRAYVNHLNDCVKDVDKILHHDAYIAAIIEQSVQRESVGTANQKPFRRLIENIVLGDARKRGQTHQWMYDRFSLSKLLSDLGYREAQVFTYSTSSIADWNKYGLDVNALGSEYKVGSLYVEAQK